MVLPSTFFPLIEAVIMLGASVAGAAVLFKWLSSSAIVTSKHWQAGGALAGAIIIFGLLMQASSQANRQMCTVINWTVSGYVDEEGAISSRDIQVQQDTAPAVGVVDPRDGHFVLAGASVLRSSENPYPSVRFLGDATHISIPYPIDRKNSDIDDASSHITLKQRVQIPKAQATFLQPPSRPGEGQ